MKTDKTFWCSDNMLNIEYDFLILQWLHFF